MASNKRKRIIPSVWRVKESYHGRTMRDTTVEVPFTGTLARAEHSCALYRTVKHRDGTTSTERTDTPIAPVVSHGAQRAFFTSEPRGQSHAASCAFRAVEDGTGKVSVCGGCLPYTPLRPDAPLFAPTVAPSKRSLERARRNRHW